LVRSESGEIALSQIVGDVAVSTANGEITLSEVDGDVEAKSVSGELSAHFEGVTPTKALKLSSASGDITLKITSPIIDADLKAETISGDIEIADEFGIVVTREMVRRRAAGQIGRGGTPVSLDTVSGDITVRK
jgi:DUF4097 and DUF4098 domain-containing protein YvlB